MRCATGLALKRVRRKYPLEELLGLSSQDERDYMSLELGNMLNDLGGIWRHLTAIEEGFPPPTDAAVPAEHCGSPPSASAAGR